MFGPVWEGDGVCDGLAVCEGVCEGVGKMSPFNSRRLSFVSVLPQHPSASRFTTVLSGEYRAAVGGMTPPMYHAPGKNANAVPLRSALP